MSSMRLARNIIPQIIFMGQVDFAMELYDGVMAPALKVELLSKHMEPNRGRERKVRRDHGIFLFRDVFLAISRFTQILSLRFNFLTFTFVQPLKI